MPTPIAEKLQRKIKILENAARITVETRNGIGSALSNRTLPDTVELTETIYRRAHVRTARSFQEIGCEIRQSYQYVRRLPGVGVWYHRIEEMSMRFCNQLQGLSNAVSSTFLPQEATSELARGPSPGHLYCFSIPHQQRLVARFRLHGPGQVPPSDSHAGKKYTGCLFQWKLLRVIPIYRSNETAFRSMGCVIRSPIPKWSLYTRKTRRPRNCLNVVEKSLSFHVRERTSPQARQSI